MIRNRRYRLHPIVLILLGVLLSACRAVSPSLEPSSTPSPSPMVTSTMAPSATAAATSTTSPPVAILLAAPGADQAWVSNLQTSLNDIVTAAGLRWQVRQQLAVDDLVPELRLVVAVPPDPGLAQLAASAPTTQFLAVGMQGIELLPNLTLLGEGGDRPDQQGFIAGVIAAMVSPDWRVGMISLSDTVEGRSARSGFLNGVEYFCGLCRPIHPPFYEYPLYIELPSTATAAEWQEAANYMVDHYAQTVYVFPGAGDESMLTILAQSKVGIISSGEPAQTASTSWVLSLTIDPLPLIQSQVAGLLDGSLAGGRALSAPIEFTQVNPAIFTPGKQRLAQQVLSDLLAGYIDTGVDLTTGEFRP